MNELLSLRNVRPRRILDLACGTGNVSQLLAADGVEVVGVDLSLPMIRQARKKAAKSETPVVYHCQDAAELDIQGPPFDLCISLFDSLNYITDPDRLKRAIHRVAQHLVEGGLFIFDINSVFALENGFFDQETLELDRKLRYVWRSDYDPETRLCTVEMRFFMRGRNGVDREFRETHIQFAYTEEELARMLDEAGFDSIQTFHGYSLLPVRPTSDRIFFVARKANPGG